MQSQQTRYYWVDVVKVIGIFLVYYGHVLQRAYHLSTDAVFFQYKLVYAFHMPLFFFVAGFFYKKTGYSTITEIGVLFQKRIFPVLLFGGISLIIWPIYMYLKFGGIDYEFIIINILPYLQGNPGLNAAVWFLVCLFTAEIWAVLFLPKVKTVFQGMLLSVFFLLFGHSLRLRTDILLILPKNFWYIHESLLAFGFYAMGYSTFNWLKKLVEINYTIRVLLIMIFGFFTVWSVNLNSPSDDFVVTMKISDHGNLYFFVSAFFGILMVIMLASILPKSKWFSYIGKNTLILLGTNGLFLSFFNSHILNWLGHYESTTWIILDSLWISVLSIGLSVPIIEILNRWLPQLVGRPQANGPILNKFLPPQYLFLRKKFNWITIKMGKIKDE